MLIMNILIILMAPILLFGEDLFSEKGRLINDTHFTAKIKRDNWGIPHIYGKTDSDVSFGLAYAHSEDDFETIQYIVYAARGKLASVYGRDAAVNDYYEKNIGWRTLLVNERRTSKY